jgi:hypothetical protein
MQYRLSQFDTTTLPFSAKLEDTMGFILRNASKETESIFSRFELVSPHQKTRESWAQINREGKKVALDTIEVNELFDLISDKVKMKVKALEKKVL